MSVLSRALNTAREEGLRELLSRTHAAVFRRTFPRVPRPLTTIRWYLRLRSVVLRERYRFEDPLTLRYVNPAEIEYVSGLNPYFGRGTSIYWGRIRQGDWDRTDERVLDLRGPRGIQQHYEDGVPWEQTSLREEFEEMYWAPVAWGYSDPDDFDQRTDDVEALADRLRTEGYVSQRERARTESLSSNDIVPPLLDEVTVDVGRDGRPLWRCFGKHRLTLATLQGIEHIPVLVGAVHEEAEDLPFVKPPA